MTMKKHRRSGMCVLCGRLADEGIELDLDANEARRVGALSIVEPVCRRHRRTYTLPKRIVQALVRARKRDAGLIVEGAEVLRASCTNREEVQTLLGGLLNMKIEQLVGTGIVRELAEARAADSMARGLLAWYQAAGAGNPQPNTQPTANTECVQER